MCILIQVLEAISSGSEIDKRLAPLQKFTWIPVSYRDFWDIKYYGLKNYLILAFPLWDSTVINGQLIYIYSFYKFNFFRPPWLVYTISEMVFEVLAIQITWRWVPWTQNLLLSLYPCDVVLCGNSFSEETQHTSLLTQNRSPTQFKALIQPK